MDPSLVIFDRFLMGFSLSIHIVLASIGMLLPIAILLAEYIGIKRNDLHYTALAKRLAIIFVVFFAVGTASGMLVAVNMLLLWPKFMQLVSQVAILPFYVEVFAFFMESIFIGIYFYSWDKFKSRYAHLLAGIPIAVGAMLSGALITMINAFMNVPTGFNIQAYISTGVITGVRPFAVFWTPATGIEIFHVLTTACFAGSFIFVAYFSWMLLKCSDSSEKAYYKKALQLFFALAVITTALAVYSGVLSISNLAVLQPEKYAAIEANFHPMTNAPEVIGGIPAGNGTLKYYIDIPSMQSILLNGTASGHVPGLSSFPQSTWPPLIIHVMFDFMVLLGFGIAFFLLLMLFAALFRRKPLESRIILWLLIITGVIAVVMLENGWVMAELGRQPWIIYNVMLVSQAANYSTSVLPITILILGFYVLVIPLTLIVLKKLFRARPLAGDLK